MKLSPQQIQDLYKFTRQHFVEHYDVQTELVDHLANDIEQIWQEQPNLSFEQARDISFKKFGVFGFMDVVGERAKALNKKYWKLVWNVFKQFFKIPQILTTIAIFLIILFGFQLFPTKYFFLTICIGSILILGFKLYFLNQEKKKRFIETNKKWLLEEYVFNLGGSIAFINLFIQLANLSPEKVSYQTIVIGSIILTSLILIIFITSFILPSKVEEILEKQYPEYKLVNC
jgi:hypothetical protein